MPITYRVPWPTFALLKRTVARVGALLCVDAYQTTGVYPYDVTAWDLDLVTGGSHKWLCGGPGCGVALRQAVAARALSPGDNRLDGARATLLVRIRPDVHAPSMYRFGTARPRFPDTSWRSPGTRRRVGRRAENSRAQRAAHRKNRGMALERGLRVNSPLDPEQRTGWIGIDFSGAKRPVVAHRAAHLRRLPSRLRNTDRSALLHDRGGNRRVVRNARISCLIPCLR